MRLTVICIDIIVTGGDHSYVFQLRSILQNALIHPDLRPENDISIPDLINHLLFINRSGIDVHLVICLSERSPILFLQSNVSCTKHNNMH